MLQKPIIVVTVLRKKIIACEVYPNTQQEIRNVREFGWDEKTLDIIFAKIQSIYSIRKVRLLLTREVCYVLRLSVPKDLEVSDKRKLILEKMIERIPDVVEDRDFDYKVVQEQGDDEDVLAFAPISALSVPLSKAVALTHMVIEATEPEEIAKTRSNNPLIGIALKEDLSGKDDEVLNVNFYNEEGSDIRYKKVTRAWKRYLFVFLLSMVFGALLFFMILKLGFISVT